MTVQVYSCVTGGAAARAWHARGVTAGSLACNSRVKLRRYADLSRDRFPARTGGQEAVAQPKAGQDTQAEGVSG